MKPVLKPILGLAMVLFMASSCVSSPPAATQVHAAEVQEEAQTEALAQAPEASIAAADLDTAEQPLQPTPMPESQLAPAVGSASSVPPT